MQGKKVDQQGMEEGTTQAQPSASNSEENFPSQLHKIFPIELR